MLFCVPCQTELEMGGMRDLKYVKGSRYLLTDVGLEQNLLSGI